MRAKLSNEILLNMCILIIFSTIFVAYLTVTVLHDDFYDEMRKRTEAQAIYMANMINYSGEDYIFEAFEPTDEGRLTLIKSDGRVLYDSEKDAADMESHLERPEVKEAIKYGWGEEDRLSETMDRKTFYYAIRLDNGDIIRFSNSTDSVFAIIYKNIPYVILICIIIVMVSIFVARLQTRKIIKPINGINLESPFLSNAYEELEPLLRRMEKQNAQISDQLNALRKKQEEIATITKNMNEGLVFLDIKGNVLSINKSAENILGVGGRDYLQRHIISINRSPVILEAVKKASEGETFETIFDIHEKKYQVFSSPVIIDAQISGTVMFILDVTEKVEAERLRREFSANVSHELKTPLTSISGYAEIMKNGLVKPEDMTGFSERIYNEASRLVTLIDDIIKLSRLDEKESSLVWENIDIYDLAEKVKERLNHYAQSRNVEISISGERIKMNCIGRIMEEIIYNLCDNAIKYNVENGKVNIDMHIEGDSPVLIVSDTGIGIDKKYHSRVFERFYRVDKSHSKETGGTGLGLSIVKHGAICHNAKLDIKSEPGKGTSISLIFPKRP
ncbi:sensor histidine kinase [Anaeropeptidivorans aminofermentans]|uniref:sensor histidine kinase n=1 Tax=Anaeropeptidivorans aminofermentans TaxID=2934315 RepID=UPI002025246F|nr:ATP-binding protein [Anaeropeptidivorans aminofermentans]